MDKWQNCWRKIMLKINNIKMQIKSTKNDLKNKLEKLNLKRYQNVNS